LRHLKKNDFQDALRWFMASVIVLKAQCFGGEYGPYSAISERGDITRSIMLSNWSIKGMHFYAFKQRKSWNQMRIDQKEQGLPQKYDALLCQ